MIHQSQPQQGNDYRTSAQIAAAGFIRRHQHEHLDDDQLFSRTVSYLVNTLEVPAFMADRIAYLAMIQQAHPVTGVDTAPQADGRLALVDYRSGDRQPIHARLLPQRFLATV